MKKLVTTMFLICAAMLLFSPQAGFAYENVNQGCLATGCHVVGAVGTATPPQLHGIAAHTASCANCHPNGAPGKNVLSSKCAGCHTPNATNACPLIATPHGNPPTCLTSACHGPVCAPPVTTTVPATTTVPTETTTTTTPSETTTTTAPAGCILTIDPAEIEVDGTNAVTEDVKVTIDAGSLTEADLQGLDVSFSDACSQYITVNTVNNIAISGKKAEATVNITVKGNAATSECKLIAKNTSGTINCETTFTITKTANTTTTTIPTECQIKSIQPTGIRIGLGLIPRIRRVTLTVDVDLESLGITCADLNIQNAPQGVSFISCAVVGDSIEATILFWRVQPGTYNLDLAPCGSIPFVITRF
jgi:hypothetical protein